jgi:thiamine transporter
MNTKKIVLIGLFSAMAFILAQFKVYQMSNGGAVTLYLVPIWIAAFNDDLKTSFFIGIILATLNTIIGGFVLNILQVGLDYYIPITVLSMCMMFKINKITNILIASLIALASYTLSGIIFWNVPLWGSIVYNVTFFIPLIIVNTIIVLLINPKLEKVYPK